jgi:hypothetical protein
MHVLATAYVDSRNHVSLRPSAAETGSWVLSLDGGARGGEIVLMFADTADAHRVLAALLHGLPGGEAA